ncbi:MAG: LUD domain-containing protein [Desulfobacterales bacterium]
MTKITTENYVAEARKAIQNRVLQAALADLQDRFGRGTAECYRKLPEGPDLRLKAHEIRMKTIENLDFVLETLSANIRQNGGHVFFAEDTQAAVNYCLDVAHRHNVKRVVKGKSMVSEEIGLNDALIEAGIDVSETDLGEYIIQLAGETPSHIIAPAIHKTRIDIGHLFADKLDLPFITAGRPYGKNF